MHELFKERIRDHYFMLFPLILQNKVRRNILHGVKCTSSNTKKHFICGKKEKIFAKSFKIMNIIWVR